MSNNITSKTIVNNFAQIEKDFILEETPKIKIVFRAQIHSDGIRGKIIRIKLKSNKEWKEEKAQDFRKLKTGEGGQIEISTKGIKQFNKAIDMLISLLKEKGVEYGRNQYVTARADEVIITDTNKANFINELLAKGYSDDIWKKIVESDPDLATKLSLAQIQNNRKKSLKEFEDNINDSNKDENYWQEYFNRNKWIFGYGLKYQILNLISDQPNYGGTTVSGTGGQRGDYLEATQSDSKFTVLVEIKKPNTSIITDTEQRNGCYKLSRDLLDGVSQVQVNCRTWEIDGATREGNIDILNEIITCRPKGILIIGKGSQLNNRNKKITFETFRRDFNSVEIITFDELLERARYIIGDTEEYNTTDNTDYLNDIPFK